jgi:hypothetical protein
VATEESRSDCTAGATRHTSWDCFECEGRLSHLLIEGRSDHTLNFNGAVEDVAQNILGTLEGAMLVARPCGDLHRFNAPANQLLASLTNSDQTARKRRSSPAHP